LKYLILITQIICHRWYGGKEKTGKEIDAIESNPGEMGKEKLTTGIKILERLELPKELKEVSGIACLTNGRFACIQDEKGVVFIFNSLDGKLEREIPFSDDGDYEGIAVAGQTIYVIRADGKLFMIENMNDPEPVVKEYETGLIENDIESLCYEKAGNRLLMTGKDKDPDGQDHKKIFSFDIQSKKLNSAPVLTIDLNKDLICSGKKELQPSDMGIHPVSSDIYLIDGPAEKLLILDPEGAVKNVYELDSKIIPQPEGISFGENGDIYISTEGDKSPGAILKVAIPNP